MGEQPRHYSTTAACSCADWKYRPRARPCKHVKAIWQARDLIGAQGRFNEQLRESNGSSRGVGTGA